MAKVQTKYVCTSCGYQSAKPLGRCPECQAWNSFEEAAPSSAAPRSGLGAYGGVVGGKLTALSAVGRREEPRLPSGIPELDRVLGGGFGMLKGLLGATLFFLLANLATDMVYGPRAERPDWMRDSRTYPLLNATGRAIVDWVETNRHPGVTL